MSLSAYGDLPLVDDPRDSAVFWFQVYLPRCQLKRSKSLPCTGTRRDPNHSGTYL